MTTRLRTYLPVLATIALILALRLPTFLHPLLEIDEAIYAAIANLMLDGGVLYGDGGIDHKPPVIYFIYELCFALGGRNNMLLMQLVNALTVLATGACLMGIVALVRARCGLAGRRTYLPLLLYGVGLSSFYFEQMSANAEVFMNLFVSAGALLFLGPGRRRLTALFLSGVLFALAAYTKQISLLTYACFGAALVLEAPLTVRRMGALATFLAAGVVVSGLFAGYFALRGALGEYLTWVFIEPWSYVGGKSMVDVDVLTRAGLHTLAIVGAGLVIYALGLWFLFGRATVRAPYAAARPLLRLMQWWFIATLPQIVMGGRFLFHYYLLLLPPLCIAAALLLAQWARFDERPRFRRALLAAVIVPALLWLPIFFAHTTLEQTFGKFRDYRAVGAYLKERSAASERVFVWGFSAEVYYYADRLPASRFVFADLLAGILLGFGDGTRGYSSQRYWDLFDQDLALHGPPAFVVDTAPAGFHGYTDYPLQHYPRLAALVAQHYHFERAIGGMHIYRRNDQPPP